MIALNEIDETKIIECLRNQSVKNRVLATRFLTMHSYLKTNQQFQN